MEVFQTLPEELRLKMLYFSHPIMNSNMKHAIRITAAHHKIKRIESNWNHDYSWNETVCENTTQEERSEIIDILSKCGCCIRHSQGVYQEPHCSHITGSHTTKKFHNKEGFNYKRCTCWCRSNIRIFMTLENI